MFSTMLEEAEEETVSRMVPVILERVGLLYPVQNYQQEIHQYVKAVLLPHNNHSPLPQVSPQACHPLFDRSS